MDVTLQPHNHLNLFFQCVSMISSQINVKLTYFYFFALVVFSVSISRGSVMSHAVGRGKGKDLNCPQDFNLDRVSSSLAVGGDSQGPQSSFVSSSGGDGDATTVPQGAGVQAGAEVKQGVTVQSDTEGPRVSSSGGDGDATTVPQGAGEQASAEEESGADEQVSSEEEQGVDEQTDAAEEQGVDEQIDTEGPRSKPRDRGVTIGSDSHLPSTRHAPKEALAEDVEEIESCPPVKREPQDEASGTASLEDEVLKLRLELRQLRKENASLRKEKMSPPSPGVENKTNALDRHAAMWWSTEDGRFLRYMEHHYHYASLKEGGRKFRFRGDKWLPETIESFPFYEGLHANVKDMIDDYIKGRYTEGIFTIDFIESGMVFTLGECNKEFPKRHCYEACFTMLLACCVFLLNIDIRITKSRRMICMRLPPSLKDYNAIDARSTFVARRFLQRFFRCVNASKKLKGFDFAKAFPTDELNIEDYFIGVGILNSYAHMIPPTPFILEACERLVRFIDFLDAVALVYRKYFEFKYCKK